MQFTVLYRAVLNLVDNQLCSTVTLYSVVLDICSKAVPGVGEVCSLDLAEEG